MRGKKRESEPTRWYENPNYWFFILFLVFALSVTFNRPDQIEFFNEKPWLFLERSWWGMKTNWYPIRVTHEDGDEVWHYIDETGKQTRIFLVEDDILRDSHAYDLPFE